VLLSSSSFLLDDAKLRAVVVRCVEVLAASGAAVRAVGLHDGAVAERVA